MKKGKFINEIKASLKAALNTQFGQIFRSPTTALTFGGIVAALSLVAGWIPDGLTALIFERNFFQGFLMLEIALMVLCILICLGYILRHSLEWVFYEYKPKPKKGLILFLSPLGDKNLKIFQQYFEELKQRNASLDNIKIEVINNQRSEAANKLGSWTMPIKAIQHHKDTLQKVIVITSGASSLQFPRFKEFIETPPPKLKGEEEIMEIKVKTKDKKISPIKSFEDLEAVAEAIKDAYKKLKENGIDEKDTIVDITSGQTSNSAAAAILTVLDDKEFQYVSTVDYEVRAYDVRLK